MNQETVHIANLLKEVELPASGINSRPIFHNDRLRVTLFGLSPDDAMTEHSTTMEAIVQVLQGEGTMTLGGESKPLQVGTWVHMPPGLPHSILPSTPMVFLLTLLKPQA
jgi:quercetin dioxygenase-like cupin family protein